MVALIVAAGRGSRFGGAAPKQYARLAGLPLLRHSLLAFAGHPKIDAVQAVIHPDDRDLFDAAAEGLKLLPPVDGGESRQHSVLRGLESLASLEPYAVLVHDGARPYVTEAVISRIVAGLKQSEGVVAALPVVETLKRVDPDERRISDTVQRENLWHAQTPQGFRFDAILTAHRHSEKSGLLQNMTDDSAVAEHAGLTISVVEGDPRNIKVTTAEDLKTLERWMCPENDSRQQDLRTASGFDVHRFGTGDAVLLCGVTIPHSRGLQGHSDADVGLHALTDAILGTIAAGDIGQHFPPSESRWRDASSKIFLDHAARLVREMGGTIRHLDITLICEEPKIAPHKESMRHVIAEIVRIDAARVSIKATTTEGLGFAGRGEGIAAQATATVSLP